MDGARRAFSFLRPHIERQRVEDQRNRAEVDRADEILAAARIRKPGHPREEAAGKGGVGAHAQHPVPHGIGVLPLPGDRAGIRISCLSGLLKPERSLLFVSLDADAVPIDSAQFMHGKLVSGLCPKAVKLCGAGWIARNALAIFQHPPEIIQSVALALLGSFFIPGRCGRSVLLNADTFSKTVGILALGAAVTVLRSDTIQFGGTMYILNRLIFDEVKVGKIIGRERIFAFRCPGEQLKGALHVFFHADAALIAQPERPRSGHIALRGCRTIERGGPFAVLFDPAADLTVQPKQELRARQPLRRRLFEERYGRFVVLLHAHAFAVERAEIALPLRAALLRGLAVEGDGLFHILLHAAPGLIADAEVRHRAYVSRLCAALPEGCGPRRIALGALAGGAAESREEHRVAVPAVRGKRVIAKGLGRIGRDAVAVVIAARRDELGAHKSHVGRPAEEGEGLFPVLLAAAAVEVHHAQRADPLRIVLARGLLIEEKGLFQIERHALAELVAHAKQLLRAGKVQLGGAGKERSCADEVLLHADPLVVFPAQTALRHRIPALRRLHQLFKFRHLSVPLFHPVQKIAHPAPFCPWLRQRFPVRSGSLCPDRLPVVRSLGFCSFSVRKQHIIFFTDCPVFPAEQRAARRGAALLPADVNDMPSLCGMFAAKSHKI